MNRVWLIAWVGFVLVGEFATADPARDAAATLVLYNRNDAGSRDLAKYYAEKRGIPFSQVLGLNTPAEEEITRDQYLVHIAAPVRSAFEKNKWWRIRRDSNGDRVVSESKMRFAAIIKGVPMKIKRDGRPATSAIEGEIPAGSPMEKLIKHNEASVDSELAAIFALRDETAGPISNPYFRRLLPIFETPPSASPLLVCRLDAPTDAAVRQMIDHALTTEKTGLWGIAYVDARGIKSAGYVEGDDWLFNAAKEMRRQGIPVITDYGADVLPTGYPVTDAAVYYGWYMANVSGPFASSDFRFVPGAVAVHIHSFSARTMRSEGAGWSAPLVMRGAAATVGNVYEPYLSLTVNLDVFQERLMEGLTLGESAYAGSLGISWMGVVIGDPLYRPYADWHRIRLGSAPDSPFRDYRDAVLAADGNTIAAGTALRRLSESTGNSIFLEGLGQALAAEGQNVQAVEVLEGAAEIAKDPAVRFRIALAQIEFLRRGKLNDQAAARIANALGEFRDPAQRAILDKLALAVGS